MKCKTCAFGTGGGYCTLSEKFKHNCRKNNYSTYEEYVETVNKEDPDTITLKRIYSTHCQVCGRGHNSPAIVWFVPDDNNLVCHRCAFESGLKHEPRIYYEGYPYEPRIYKEGGE